MIFGREPALILGVVNAALAAAVGFGLDIDPEQVGMINAAIAAVIAFVTRQSVFAPETVKRDFVERGTSTTSGAAAYDE